MWYRNENGSNVKPEAVDRTSSKAYVYVRKDFSMIKGTDEIPEHWEWLEQKVQREDWETYQTVMEHSSALDDVYAAMAELAEMIVEG